MNTWEFFYHQAGYGYRPEAESEVMARAVAAVELARAEAWARENRVRWHWQEDASGADVQREDGTWEHLPAVRCVGDIEHCSQCGNLLHVGSLWGITESDDREQRLAYRRVVQAELVLEFLWERGRA